jgi:adenine-specific DNA-methyltransferase
MGEYFDAVTKPRVQKVIYSPDWKGGKPVAHGKGSSHAFKYLRLEGYEDTLNNLVMDGKATELAFGMAAAEQAANDTTGTANTEKQAFKEAYMLGYILDVESRESLLNTTHFHNPFAMTLRITRQHETREQVIDLVETFSYLLGVVVTRTSSPAAGFRTVAGTLLTGERVLMVWRDCATTDTAVLETVMRGLSPNDYARVYLNGDHTLDKTEFGEVLLLETEFRRLAFGF